MRLAIFTVNAVSRNRFLPSAPPKQGGYAVTVFFFITGFVLYLGYSDKVCRDDFKYWVRLRAGRPPSAKHLLAIHSPHPSPIVSKFNP